VKRRTALAAGCLAAGVAVAGVVWVPKFVPGQGEPDRPPQEAPAIASADTLRFAAGAPQLSFLETTAAELQPEPLMDALPGRIAYDEDRTARVGAPVDGRVTAILVNLGDTVVPGAPLAHIEAPDYAQASADAARDELELQRARQSYDRAARLTEGGVMPRREFEAAEIGLREAEVELARARRRLAALGQGGAGRDGLLVLRAPIGGVVTERTINPGTLVGPGTGAPLFVISDPARLRVIVDVPEQSIAALAKGQRARVEVDAYPGRSFEAEVVHVGDVLDAATRRLQVRARIDNGERLLKPEMYARVLPFASDAVRRVRVPNTAVVTAGVKSYVFVERAPGEFQRRLVVPSAQGREDTFLAAGVMPGERVVASGALLLQSELQGN
jgi:cobalt-zinc-cadmium efflux system membrane fusion protein